MQLDCRVRNFIRHRLGKINVCVVKYPADMIHKNDKAGEVPNRYYNLAAILLPVDCVQIRESGTIDAAAALGHGMYD